MIYFQLFTTFRYKSLKNSEKIILEKLDKLEEALSREADHDIKADA